MDSKDENQVTPAENQTTTELDVNRKNRENYEKLMEASSTKTDDYWDRDNIFIKIVLGILGIIIVIGVIYYVTTYLGSR